MKVICIGDIVSVEGRDIFKREIVNLKREYNPDFMIVNGENSAIGNGIDRESIDEILNYGADCITGGNHSFQKKGIGEVFEEYKNVLRPLNSQSDYGYGEAVFDLGKITVRVISLEGNLYLSEKENAFQAIEKALKNERDEIVIVDFHAEATSEKQAMGYYLDGKVSLVFGTHTHIQTADEKILEKGTGYITDIGMTGSEKSVLGKDIGVCVHNFHSPDERKSILDASAPPYIISGIFADIDDKTKKCKAITRIYKTLN